MKENARQWMMFWGGVVVGAAPWMIFTHGVSGAMPVAIVAVLLVASLAMDWRNRSCPDCKHLRSDHSPAGCLVRTTANSTGFCRCKREGGLSDER